jgi:hypothetical protein
MIFLDLVGGGGRANVSWPGFCAIDDLRRVFTTSLAGIAGDGGEVEFGWYEEAEDDSEDMLDEGRDSVLVTAGGGSSNEVCKEEN